MADRSPDAPPPDAPEERLDSWKAIANYLKRDVTTVQRWEKREGMPVQRHLHDKLGSVYAFRSELDAWSQRRKPGPPAPAVTTRPSPDVGSAATASDQTTISWTRTRLWISAAAIVAALAAPYWLLARSEYFWRNPLINARFESVTDFGGAEQAAAISPDGRFVAFLSDHDGTVDVWVTEASTGQFHNLTRGRIRELINPAVRELGFSPDGSQVTFWARGGRVADRTAIDVWSVPTLGGAPRPAVEGAAEVGWSADGSRVVYHTPGPGDPMFVREAVGAPRQIFAAAPGLHAHFPLWSPNGRSIYFVEGALPDATDIWRISAAGGPAERVTRHNSQVSHPVFLDARTLAYLALNPDGTGPSIYSVDVERRVPHRLENSSNRYVSLAASADGRRLVATRASRHGTLWRIAGPDAGSHATALDPVPLTTRSGFAPRLGPGYLLYASAKRTGDGIWKRENGATTELWSAPDARIVGGPEISADGRQIVFTVERARGTALVSVNADGTDPRTISETLALRGAPAWSPDGRSVTSGVADAADTPRLTRIALDGSTTTLSADYSMNPVWSPDGGLVAYTGPDVGTTFAVRAATRDGTPRAVPDIFLTRGGRRIRFAGGGRSIVVLRGDLQHKDLWVIDLATAAERRLTTLPSGFDVRDFDISPDGREIVVERVQERSDVVLIDLGR